MKIRDWRKEAEASLRKDKKKIESPDTQKRGGFHLIMSRKKDTCWHSPGVAAG